MTEERRVLWTDRDGDSVRLGVGGDAQNEPMIRLYYRAEPRASVYLPTSPDDKRHLLTELADVLGMEWDGLRAARTKGNNR
jgi:hypothetical protein